MADSGSRMALSDARKMPGSGAATAFGAASAEATGPASAVPSRMAGKSVGRSAALPSLGTRDDASS